MGQSWGAILEEADMIYHEIAALDGDPENMSEAAIRSVEGDLNLYEEMGLDGYVTITTEGSGTVTLQDWSEFLSRTRDEKGPAGRRWLTNMLHTLADNLLTLVKDQADGERKTRIKMAEAAARRRKEALRAQKMMRRVVGRLQSRAASDCVKQWHSVAHKTMRASRMVRRAVSRIQNRSTADAVMAWRRSSMIAQRSFQRSFAPAAPAKGKRGKIQAAVVNTQSEIYRAAEAAVRQQLEKEYRDRSRSSSPMRQSSQRASLTLHPSDDPTSRLHTRNAAIIKRARARVVKKWRLRHEIIALSNWKLQVTLSRMSHTETERLRQVHQNHIEQLERMYKSKLDAQVYQLSKEKELKATFAFAFACIALNLES